MKAKVNKPLFWLLTLLVGLVLLGLALGASTKNVWSQAPCDPGYEEIDWIAEDPVCAKRQESYVVLRSNTSGNWSSYISSTHPRMNVGALTQTSTYLSVPLTVSNTWVTHAEAAEDEQIAMRGYNCGVSGGITSVTIYCGDENGNQVNPNVITGDTTNLWVKVEGYVAQP